MTERRFGNRPVRQTEHLRRHDVQSVADGHELGKARTLVFGKPIIQGAAVQAELPAKRRPVSIRRAGHLLADVIPEFLGCRRKTAPRLVQHHVTHRVGQPKTELGNIPRLPFPT